MLDQRDVAKFLLERELISPKSIVDGDLVVREASSRNRNFRVERKSGVSYLLKQGVTADGVATVAHEAAVYRMLSGLHPQLGRYLPVFYGYDPVARVLILELLKSGRDMRSHHLRHGRFAVGLAGRMGRALGTLH